MKIQLDTVAKTIKIEENVNLGELITALELLLPNGLWKEFTLETHTVINWGVQNTVYPWYPHNPYRPNSLDPYFTITTNTTDDCKSINDKT